MIDSILSENFREETTSAWIGSGKIRGRRAAANTEIRIDGITTQSRYYKLLVHEFMRKEMPTLRPNWADYVVQIDMEYQGSRPHLDLDNLAKALLDALTGYVFFDDSQVADLRVRRFPGERDGISLIAFPAPEQAPP